MTTAFWGELSLWLGLLTAVWSTLLLVAAATFVRDDLLRTGARGLVATTALAVVVAAALETALYRGDFALRYVAAVTGANLSAPLRLAALWAGPTGMQLAASVFLAGFTAIALGSAFGGARRARGNGQGTMAGAAWAAAVLGALTAVILARVAVEANPFAPSVGSLVDGRGLPPDLHNAAAAAYRALLLAGDAAAAVAIAFGAAGLGTEGAAAWTLAAWEMLLAAAVARAWWMYASVTKHPLDAMEFFALIAWAGASAWLCALAFKRRATDDRAGRIRIRAGAATMALGAALVAAAAVGHVFRLGYDVTIRDGESWHAKDPRRHDWTFTSQGASRMERPDHYAVAVALIPARDGVRGPFLTSEIREYVDAAGADTFAPWTKPGIARGAWEDVRVVLRTVGEGEAQLHLAFEPLLSLAWAGAALLLLGGGVAFWPLSSAMASSASRSAGRSPGVLADAAEQAIGRWREQLTVCPECGPRPEMGATFCSNCGKPIARRQPDVERIGS